MYAICINRKVCFFFLFAVLLHVLSCHCVFWYMGWWKEALWKLYDLLGSWAVIPISCKDINSHLPMNSSRSYRVTSFATRGEDQKCLSHFQNAVGGDEGEKNTAPVECSGRVFWAVTEMSCGSSMQLDQVTHAKAWRWLLGFWFFSRYCSTNLEWTMLGHPARKKKKRQLGKICRVLLLS